jgi:hypothetical protein
MTPNTITLTSSQPNNNNVHFVLRIELIQTNPSNLYQPSLTSVSINTDNLGGIATTNYSY